MFMLHVDVRNKINKMWWYYWWCEWWVFQIFQINRFFHCYNMLKSVHCQCCKHRHSAPIPSPAQEKVVSLLQEIESLSDLQIKELVSSERIISRKKLLRCYVLSMTHFLKNGNQNSKNYTKKINPMRIRTQFQMLIVIMKWNHQNHSF